MRAARQLVAAAIALGSLGSTAVADRTDFPTCPDEVGTCGNGVDDCCERAFAARSIVIPLDRCHQPTARAGALGIPTAAAPNWCAAPGTVDDGVFAAYGLAYRLVQHGVPVYWVVDARKRRGDAIDAWIVGAGAAPPRGRADLTPCGLDCVAPVARLAPADLTALELYPARQLPLRGGAFVIAADDRAVFDDLWLRRGAFAARAANPLYDFSAVDLYELQPGARFVGGAPVAARLDLAPPRLARVAPGGPAAIWLERAKLLDPASNYPACLTGAFEPSTAVFCDVRPSDLAAGYLVQGEFDAVLVDVAPDRAACERLDEFAAAIPGVRAGGNALFVGTGCPGARPRAVDDAGHLLVQGSERAPHPVAYGRHRGVEHNGVVVYAGGDVVDSVPPPATVRTLLNAMLATPRATVAQAPDETVVAVSRSAPVVATVAGSRVHYQGTYDAVAPARLRTVFDGAADVNRFRFPHVTGDVRGFDPARLAPVALPFSDLGQAVMSAASGVPPAAPAACAEPFAGECRTVFTHVDSGVAPERIVMSPATAARLRPLLGTALSDVEAELLIGLVLAAPFGGVDRSTMAIVGDSPFAPGQRPAMIYVGALDGMLHAVCAEVLGPCTRRGQELWAFVPRTQLPLLRRNAQRVDGSPRVADVFGDFDGDGTRTWRTLLAVQTGATSGVYALDVTDPRDPRILWERPGDAVALGRGLELAMGTVRSGERSRDLLFAATNTGGEAAGLRVAAIDIVSSELAWTFERVYPAPRDPAAARVSSSALPGGVALADPGRTGSVTHVVAPSLYGELWLLDARDGASVYGDDPLLSFDDDAHPIGATPTLYVDRATSALHAVVVTGGAIDPMGAMAAAAAEQFAVAVSLSAPANRTPVAATGDVEPEAGRAFSVGLGYVGGVPNRGYAQPTVVGHELFVPTDAADANLDTFGIAEPTGRLHRLSLVDGRPRGMTLLIPAGASSVDALTSGAIHIGSGRGVLLHDVRASFDAHGTRAEVVFTPKSGRQIWLRGHSPP